MNSLRLLTILAATLSLASICVTLLYVYARLAVSEVDHSASIANLIKLNVVDMSALNEQLQADGRDYRVSVDSIGSVSGSVGAARDYFSPKSTSAVLMASLVVSALLVTQFAVLCAAAWQLRRSKPEHFGERGVRGSRGA